MIRSSSCPQWQLDRSGPAGDHDGLAVVTPLTGTRSDLILLDNLLAKYGPEALPIRLQMRSAVGPFVDRLWREQNTEAKTPFATTAPAEQVYFDIQALSPQNDLQRSLQARAAQVSTTLAQTRLLLFVESGNNIPTPFLAILVFWLVVIFVTFSLFSPLNATGFVFLSLFAFVSGVRPLFNFRAKWPFRRVAADTQRSVA
jgi:hypothetical protein